MSANDRDDELGELLRSTLSGEADGIVPAGDGLARIQQRVAARRARLRWLRPAAVLGSTAVVTAAGVGAYALVQSNQTQTVVPPTQQTSASITAPALTTTTALAGPRFPRLAIYPFTSLSQERGWESVDFAASGSNTWQSDPTQVAERWVTTVLAEPTVDKLVQRVLSSNGKRAAVTLGDAPGGSQVNPVTTVDLVKYGHAWIVVGATDPTGNLRIDAPVSGTPVTSPLHVSGPGGWGVEEVVQLDVRDASSPTSYGVAHSNSFGSGVPAWSADVSFTTPSSPAGVLVATDQGLSGNGPARIVAERVQLTPASTTPPAYFYAVKDSRITKFSARNGASVAYVTKKANNLRPADPKLVASTVYFVGNTGAGSCGSTLMSVPADATNTAASLVARPQPGYDVTDFAVAADNSVALLETKCPPTGNGPQDELVVTEPGSPHPYVVTNQAEPPTLASLSFEPGASAPLLDGIFSGGMSSYSLSRYDPAHAKTFTDSQSACDFRQTTDGRPTALETDSTGTIWFAVQTGSSMDVLHCAAGTNNASVAFSIPGNDYPQDVDVATGGGAVLLTDQTGHVWRWDGPGSAPQQLHPSQPLYAVTW